MTRDEFFAQLEAGAKWDIGVSIHRTNPVPIDANSVFKTYEDALEYCKTDPTAHYGQILVVVTDPISQSKVYLVIGLGAEAQLKEIGAGGGGSSVTLTAGSGIKIDPATNTISTGGVLVGKHSALTESQMKDLKDGKYDLWFAIPEDSEK